jgi:hypothetical protein
MPVIAIMGGGGPRISRKCRGRIEISSAFDWRAAERGRSVQGLPRLMRSR